MDLGGTILFDGVCNLCNGSVRFIIANDPQANFRFAALQSAAGSAALTAAGKNPLAGASIVLIDRTGIYERSDAVLRILRGLRAPWPALALLRIVPVRVRDPIYNLIARNRYRWFGRRDLCAVPSAKQQARFV